MGRAHAVFDHVGLTTTEPQPNEDWVEQSRSGSPIRATIPTIEFLRYARNDSAESSHNPHVAFRVESLEPHIEGQEILIPPFVVGDFCASSSFANTARCSNTCSI